jgi:hypothetical protein
LFFRIRAFSGNIWIKLKDDKQGQSTIGRLMTDARGLNQMLEKQLQITEVSPADLNSKSNIKFKYDAGNKILTDGTLVFFRQKWGHMLLQLDLQPHQSPKRHKCRVPYE